MPLTESPNLGTASIADLLPLDSTSLDRNLRLQANTLLGHLGDIARQELQARSIHIPPALCLKTNHRGRLMLASPHPQAKQIRLWLNNNHALTERFKELELLFELVHCSEEQKALPIDSHFCLGLTSAGPLAYFEQIRHQPRHPGH